ncbi:Hypothetical predicted protein [Olea europaea subsp. europaea]|uniref:Uncharacterized protein n=1 Tax=Olea europaea subsp. europaea TaxID=158383 RepID=A0A8S0UVH3_OLEEU|nr:Hypothetical predicted protein [Olea europaea subsp. europaea]
MVQSISVNLVFPQTQISHKLLERATTACEQKTHGPLPFNSISIFPLEAEVAVGSDSQTAHVGPKYQNGQRLNRATEKRYEKDSDFPHWSLLQISHRMALIVVRSQVEN